MDGPESREASDSGTRSRAVLGNIFWLSHLIERLAQDRLPEFDAPAGMSFSRASLILAVANGQLAGASRMSDVAMDIGLTARTVTTMVDSLERDGLMLRRPDPNDRRAIQLELTAAGDALVSVLARALEDLGAAVLAPLSKQEQASLLALLDRLIERDASES